MREIQERTPQGVTNFRRTLEEGAVDALVTAPPGHWHTPAAILALTGNAYTLFDEDGQTVRAASSKWGEAAASLEGTGLRNDLSHVQDVLTTIRTGQRPNSSIEGGHKSTLMSQLGNISLRTGRALTCDPANGHIEGDEEAMQLWSRSYAPGWKPTV